MSQFLRRSLVIFIIKGFRTIVFIFIVISTTFRPTCSPAFFFSGTFTELRPTSFIESTGVACYDSVSHNRVQVLSIPILLLTCSQDWTWNLQMIVSLEAWGTNAYNCYDNSEWIFGTYKLNVFTWLELLLLCMIFTCATRFNFFFSFARNVSFFSHRNSWLNNWKTIRILFKRNHWY